MDEFVQYVQSLCGRQRTSSSIKHVECIRHYSRSRNQLNISSHLDIKRKIHLMPMRFTVLLFVRVACACVCGNRPTVCITTILYVTTSTHSHSAAMKNHHRYFDGTVVPYTTISNMADDVMCQVSGSDVWVFPFSRLCRMHGAKYLRAT